MAPSKPWLSDKEARAARAAAGGGGDGNASLCPGGGSEQRRATQGLRRALQAKCSHERGGGGSDKSASEGRRSIDWRSTELWLNLCVERPRNI